jgi:nitrile hydratase subunit beta
MNGPHDMGGMHGFGPVLSEENLHTPDRWELRMHAIMRVARSHRLYNIDEFRHAIERMPPAEYLASSYYERWLSAIERLLVEKQVVREDEVAARVALLQERPDATVQPSASLVPAPGAEPLGIPTTAPARTEPRFQPGDAVRARNQHPTGHTRLPRYVRGKRGVIHKMMGVHVFADTHAHGQGEQAQPLYSVRFEAEELWSESADGRGAVYVDLWEAYLDSE